MGSGAPRAPKRPVARARFTCDLSERAYDPCPHCGGAGAFTKPYLVIKTCFHCGGTGFLDFEVDAVLAEAVTQALGLLRTTSPKAYGLAHMRLLNAQRKAAELLGRDKEISELSGLVYVQVGNEPTTSDAPLVIEAGAA